MKTFSIFCSFVFAIVTISFAEPSASPSPKSGHAKAATSSSGANEATGSIVEFVPGQTLVLNTGTQNQHFKISGQAQYLNPKGKQIQERKLKKDRKVRVHYAKQGEDMVVDRVTLVREGGHKKGKKQQ
jgi:hypothetical protein